jgi:YD repeat-containing protein
LVQELVYDAFGEHVARRSVPVSEGTPERDILYDVYEHDALGREVQHTTPWNAVVKTDYDGLRVEVTEPGEHVTVIEQDPLGRMVSVTDAARGVIRYGYGPFDSLYAVRLLKRRIRPKYSSATTAAVVDHDAYRG